MPVTASRIVGAWKLLDLGAALGAGSSDGRRIRKAVTTPTA